MGFFLAIFFFRKNDESLSEMSTVLEKIFQLVPNINYDARLISSLSKHFNAYLER